MCQCENCFPNNRQTNTDLSLLSLLIGQNCCPYLLHAEAKVSQVLRKLQETGTEVQVQNGRKRRARKRKGQGQIPYLGAGALSRKENPQQW
jgi:hypothetical protein